jgi:tetrapyrrole methylase family protein/MazG family protein
MTPPQQRPDIGRLYDIMARLRAPDGCPWDREQTHESLKPYLVEEAYEVMEAIDAESPPDLCEELGDLLLQIIFHAQLAEEEGQFHLGDVIDAISEKMVRRHPHVFGHESIETSDEVLDRWEEIKLAEGRTLFGGTPKALPALLRAQRIGEKASGVGFDWSEISGVLAKVHEELGELETALEEGPQRIFEETGDLLFAITSLSRHLDIVAEDALRQATSRFEDRFIEVERLSAERGKTLRECDEAELDRLWEAAKAALRDQVGLD